MSELQLFTPSLEELVDIQVYGDALREFSPSDKGNLPLVWMLEEYPSQQVYDVGQLLDFAEHPELCDRRTLRAMALAIISSNDTWNHLLCFLLKSVVEEFDVFLEMALYCRAKHDGVHDTVRETLIYRERDSILERIFALQVFEPVRDELLITSSLKFVAKELRDHVFKLDKEMAILLGYAAELAFKAESNSGVFPTLYKCCTKSVKKNSSNVLLLEGGAGLKFVDVLRIAVLTGDSYTRTYKTTAGMYLEELQKMPKLTEVDECALDRLYNVQLPVLECNISEVFLEYVCRHYRYSTVRSINVLRCRCGEERLRGMFENLCSFHKALAYGINNYTGWELTEEQAAMVMKYVPRISIGYRTASIFKHGLIPLNNTNSELVCQYFAEGWKPLEILLERYPANGLAFPEEIFHGFYKILDAAEEDVPLVYRCAYYWRSCDPKFFELIDSNQEGLEELLARNYEMIEKARKMQEAGKPFHLAEWTELEELNGHPLSEEYPYSAVFCLKAGTEVSEGKVYWLESCITKNPRFALGNGMPYIIKALMDERYVSADVLLEAAKCCIKYEIEDLWETACFVDREQSWYLEEYPNLQEVLRRGLYSTTELTALEIAAMTEEQFENFCCSGGEVVEHLKEELRALLKKVENPGLLCRVIQRFGWDDSYAKMTNFKRLEDLGKIPAWLAESEEHAMLYLFGKKKGLKAMTKLAGANQKEFLCVPESSLLFDYRFVSECVDWENFSGFEVWQYVRGTKSYDIRVSEDDLDILVSCPCLQKLKDTLNKEDYMRLARSASIRGEAAAVALLSNLEKHSIEYYKGLGDKWYDMMMYNLDWNAENVIYAGLLEHLDGKCSGVRSVPSLVASICRNSYHVILKLAGISMFRVHSEFEKFAGIIMDGTLDWFDGNHWRTYKSEQWIGYILRNMVDGTLFEWITLSLSPNFCSPIGIPQELTNRICRWRERQLRNVIADGRAFSDCYLSIEELYSDDLASTALFTSRRDGSFCLFLQEGADSWAVETARELRIPVYRENCTGRSMEFFIYSDEDVPGIYKEFIVEEINSGGENACTAAAGDEAVA